MPESALPRLEPAASDAASALYDVRLPQLSRWQRSRVAIYGWLGYALVRSIGPTLRYEVLGWQHVQRIYDAGARFINAFWHRSIFSAMWWWRNRGVVVLNTTNFDGQWTRRVIERLGFLTAQGSSTRGGMRGLIIMAERLAEGHDVSFTIDGPRGPRYVAKSGPVILARRTGCPIMVFHIGLERAYTFEKAWDLFQIPYPFSRAVMVIAPAIRVPPDAGREALDEKHAEMQTALERVRDIAESWFSLSEAERGRVRAEWNAG